MAEQKYLSELHHEHNTWLKTLEFYEGDITVLKERLAEVSSKNSDHDMHAWTERFQNKLIIQKEQIDLLKHDIKKCEAELIANIKDNPIASDHRKVDDHSDMRERVQTFELLFNNLRKELVAFTAKWM